MRHKFLKRLSNSLGKTALKAKKRNWPNPHATVLSAEDRADNSPHSERYNHIFASHGSPINRGMLMNKERIFLSDIFLSKRTAPPGKPSGAVNLMISAYCAMRRLEISLPIALNAALNPLEPVASKYCLVPVFGFVEAQFSNIVLTLEPLATLNATE